MSDQTNELFAALSVFQGDLEHAKKDISKKGLAYKYADLAGCIDTAKPVLSANGLAVTQLMGSNGDGQTLITMLTHKSGQYISSETPMPNGKLQGAAGSNPVQVLGSVITYMRRYTFAAITGMAQEDDDGGMSGGGERYNEKKVNSNVEKLDSAAIEKLSEFIVRKGYTVEQICQSYNVGSLAEFNADMAAPICTQINEWVKASQQSQEGNK